MYIVSVSMLLQKKMSMNRIGTKSFVSLSPVGILGIVPKYDFGFQNYN